MSKLHVRVGSVRKSFAKIKDMAPVPNLIEIQSSSFNDFVQLDFLPEERQLIGLEKVLKDIFPIDHNGKLSLSYVSYELGHWACTCGKLVGIENRYQWICSTCNATGCSRLNQLGSCPECKDGIARYRSCSNCLARVAIKMPMTVDECRSNGQTFSMPLKVKIQLINWSDTVEDEKPVIHDIKEQDIFFADIPVMVDLYEEQGRFKLGNLGTFLINGVDRVIVSQLHRSPGVVFSQSKKIKDFRGRPYYLARIIPMRGSWLDFEFDSNDYLYVRIDKKKKLYVTTFLQALGFSREEIIPIFYNFEKVYCQNSEFFCVVDESLIGRRIEKGMLAENHEKNFTGKRITKELISSLRALGVDRLFLSKAALLNRVFAKDLIDNDTGEVLVEQGQAFAEDHYDLFKKFKEISFDLIQSSGYAFQPTIAMTLVQDRCFSEQDALKELHVKVWPGDSATVKEVKERLDNLLFNPRFYDLTKVGRIRFNRKLALGIAEDVVVLTKEDIIATIKYLVALRELGVGELDDIDHLGNRRVRLVGELLANQIYIGLIRMERIIRERYRIQEAHSALSPQDFLNVKPINAVLREFFGLGQLSQFMDQTNPLAEIAHKRRLSALGPGGVLKDRATFEVRDVHTSHYGRICPIETPEGQTIGLISSLATYATVNELGFIETAYRPVIDGVIKDEVVFLDAFQEANQYIAQADTAQENHFVSDKIFARHDGNYLHVNPESISYIDLSSKQLVSVSSALIPFLEHDDASRALMGANMQRQAVPLIKMQAPIVATGMEKEIVAASGAVITAKHAGVVEYVSSEKIIIRCDQSGFGTIDDWIANGIEIYHLRKFQRSSYATWIHHTPVVQEGDRVVVGDILTNGPSVQNGELALGSNLLVAFMPWHGYNFEDAIVLNKRLVSDDELASVHIDEYIVEARDTKLGPEEITKDIPNVNESMLAGLDEDGIVYVGTRVKPGDILVGKVTLKGDIQYSPEEKLLRAIFGEKSREVRDTSLRVPPGVEGTVIDVKIFSRSGIRKDKRYKIDMKRLLDKLESDFSHHIRFLENMMIEKVIRELDGKKANESTTVKVVTAKGVFKADLLQGKSLDELCVFKTNDQEANARVHQIKISFDNQMRILAGLKQEQIAKLKKGDPLPSGVIKTVKIYIAMKRSVSIGDKLAGRHGNKGVVSVIVPREDMPCLEDGTSVDIVLNPLGVPSRMNVGQILETILGLIGKKMGENIKERLEQNKNVAIKKYLAAYYDESFIDHFEKIHGNEGIVELAHKTASTGVYFETPVFDGAQFDEDIKPLLEKLNLPVSGSFRLRDGRTGDYFDQPVTVGAIYIMKLNHMVDDKLHARSVGPYSLVTQQPLGGKAQLGGQRLGEMEVWALEAHGAAYTLQEMLTYKSDDVSGRHKVYEAIVRGESVPEPGLPESFNVLVKELQSLGLQVDLFKGSKENISE